MRIFAIPALAAALALGGCQTFGDNLTTACSFLGATHQGFLRYTAANPVKPSVLAAELAAYEDASRICADPGSMTPAQAIAAVAASATRIAVMLWEAERRTGVPATP